MLTALRTRTVSERRAWPCVEPALPAGPVSIPRSPKPGLDAQADALARAIEAQVKHAMGAPA